MNHVYFTAVRDGAGLAAEVDDWTRLTPAARQAWRERLGTLRQGEILN